MGRDHPVIEHILALMELFPTPEAAVACLSSGVAPEQEELRAAYEIIDFMEEVPGGFLIYRADGGEEILYANRGLLQIFLCETLAEFREMTGGSFRGIVHPEDLEQVEESILRQITSSRFDLDYVEYRVIRRDGAVRWIEDYGHFVSSPTVGDIFYVFLVDATEKKEQQLRDQESREQKMQNLVAAFDQEKRNTDRERVQQLEVIEGLGGSYDSIFYVDIESDVIQPYRLSSRMERFFDSSGRPVPYTECIAQYVRDWVHPEDQGLVIRETTLPNIRRGLEEDGAYCLNYRVVDGGEVQYLQIRFINVGRAEKVCQLVLGCRRVDEELRQEREQKRLLEEALQNANLSIVAKNSFLSNMSHDMRTPLNAIFGFTALARSNLTDPSATAGYLDRIESASRQLLDMIDKVLKLSWTDSNEAKAEESPCELGAILTEVYDFLLPQAQEKNIQFTLDCSQVRHDAIYGDKEKLNQLVMYLANNAVTYTQPGGSVSIAAAEREELSRTSSVYQIVVRDNGVGISEEFLKQIFEPFTRERNTTLSGVHGAGLGLAIAKNLADLLGGAIEVTSAVGEGSVFTVTLRLRFRLGAENARREVEADEVTGLRLLLVEDNEINQEIETEILAGQGFVVDTAFDGAAALEKVRAAAPGAYDLILMDIQMPVMDGWEATRAIRALPDTGKASIPIIALSANVFDSDIQKSLDAGMDAHLAKPIDIPVLLWTIRKSVLSRRQTKS